MNRWWRSLEPDREGMQLVRRPARRMRMLPSACRRRQPEARREKHAAWRLSRALPAAPRRPARARERALRTAGGQGMHQGGNLGAPRSGHEGRPRPGHARRCARGVRPLSRSGRWKAIAPMIRQPTAATRSHARTGCLPLPERPSSARDPCNGRRSGHLRAGPRRIRDPRARRPAHHVPAPSNIRNPHARRAGSTHERTHTHDA